MKPRHAALLVLTLCLVWKAYAALAPDFERDGRTERVLASHGLHRERLRGASLRGLNLRGLDFSGLDLDSADLRRADLRGASFEEANLSGARLDGADLRGASFRSTDLIFTSLDGADARGADLRGSFLVVTFKGTDLRGADLRVRKITRNAADCGAPFQCCSGATDLRGARYDARTLFAPEINPVQRGMVFVSTPPLTLKIGSPRRRDEVTPRWL
ncbi:MAG: pentapeptide repeat-containing protein [Armatimonadota bacterium]